MSRAVLGSSRHRRLLIYRSLFAAFGLLPLWCSRLFAFLGGWVFWFCDARGRRIVRDNLRAFLPDDCPEAIHRCVRRSYTGFAIVMAESFAMKRFRKRHLAAAFEHRCDPFGVFTRGRHPGACIILTVHVNWELMGAATLLMDLVERIKVIVLPHGDPDIDALFRRIRTSYGGEVLLLDKAPLASLRALREGWSLGIVGDRDYTGAGLSVPFARGRMRLPIGPAALAVQTGAPIIPTLLARRGTTRFQLFVGRPIHADTERSKAAQIDQLAGDVADRLARFIAACPGQWCAFHPAFEEPIKSESSARTVER